MAELMLSSLKMYSGCNWCKKVHVRISFKLLPNTECMYMSILRNVAFQQ